MRVLTESAKQGTCISAVCLIILFFSHSPVFAQDPTIKELSEAAGKTIKKDAADTIPKLWKKGGLFNLNIAQGSLSNWQGGGDKYSFSALGFLNLFAYYKKGVHSWDNSLDLGYGYVNTTSLGLRKNDDRIDLLSKYGRSIGGNWYVATLFELRSQFYKGYAYENSGGITQKRLTSNFFAPAYILLSLGLDYKEKDFSFFISPLTARWIVVRDPYLSSIGAFGVDPGKTSRNELGAFMSFMFNREIMNNVTFKTKFDAFSNYRRNPENIDIFWNNLLAMKVNRFLSANITVDLLYDDDAIGRWQIRQLLGVGLSAKF